MKPEKTFKITSDGEISDGYHTFEELYNHRCLLFINLCLAGGYRTFWKPDYDGWFCLYADLTEGQISYHIPNKYLPLIEKRVPRDDDHPFDGHTSGEVTQRLYKLAQRNAESYEP